MSVQQRAGKFYGKCKRLVGFSATGGVIAFFAVPGPHTIVLIAGLAVGAVVAVATGKK